MLRWRILLSVWAGLMAGLAVSGQSEETKPASDLPQLAKQVQTWLDEDYPYLDALYKHLHAHPELSFQEKETAGTSGEGNARSGF
jgi:hypothetical protein